MMAITQNGKLPSSTTFDHHQLSKTHGILHGDFGRFTCLLPA